ncbi:PDZ domain-containing protein [Wenzhouxiangella sp. XN79A]|uniref:PDZ domain-containing protein n=1 Tax=Wenzhouxiangella sp. XN79A TaxID=2724193 RepID=UPI00144AE5E7|nr:PDZ domain-containing protein [Wenzhouxiangella sp. XN79A]NKI34052.1 PDZ domain-containing protein [Wenzhouxiangella sp. XN79A]
MKSVRPLIKPLLLSCALLSSPFALARDEAADREALRAELQAARAELAEAARKMAQVQRQLVEEGELQHRWRALAEDGDENIEIIIESDQVVAEPDGNMFFFGARPKLGILVGGTGDANEVLGLTPGGGAEAAGLQRGDRVLEVNGRALGGETTIGRALDGVEAGAVVPVVVQRDGEELRFDVETSAPERDVRVFAQRFGPGADFDFDIDMDALHEGLDAAERQIVVLRDQGLIPPDAPIPPIAPRLPGLFVLGGDSDLVSNHEGLARYFGTGDGVVVLRIAEDNALGLQDGDVLLSIDGETIDRPVDLGRAMIDREPGETVVLDVMRDGTLQRIEGSVPESRFPRLHGKRGLGFIAPAFAPPRPQRPASPAGLAPPPPPAAAIHH